MRRWLNTEPSSAREYILLVLLILIVDIVIAYIAARFGHLPLGIAWRLWRLFEYGVPVEVLLALLVVVTGQELGFRSVPAVLARFVGQPFFTVGLMAGASVAFGFYWGHARFSFETKCALAFGGMLLSVLYVKCGGLRHWLPWKAFAFVMFAHLLADAFIFLAFNMHWRELI